MQIREREDGDLARLKWMARREADAEQRDRLPTARLAIEVVETSEIQRRHERSRGFVQRLVYACRDGGIDAITCVPHLGKPGTPRSRRRRSTTSRRRRRTATAPARRSTRC